MNVIWEGIESSHGNVLRAKVPGGGFVIWTAPGGDAYNPRPHGGTLFCSNLRHEWDGNSLPYGYVRSDEPMSVLAVDPHGSGITVLACLSSSNCPRMRPINCALGYSKPITLNHRAENVKAKSLLKTSMKAEISNKFDFMQFCLE